jgi:short-subunit dehydrogenase
MRSYSSKLSLVTGASSGIGRPSPALRGSDLILTARSKDRLEALAAELRAAHPIKIEVIELDLAADGAPKRLFEEVGRR